MIRRIIAFGVFASLALLLVSSIAYGLISQRETARVFVTWESLEPDKWSSIWLIKTHIDPHARIELRSTGDPLGQGIAFGVPGAPYQRSATQSTFESLLVGFQ